MTVLVTLEVYSGRRNPTWTLSDDQIKDLVARRDKNRAAFTRAAMPGVLGYRGFTLSDVRTDGGRMTAETLGRPLLGGRVADAEVEEFLLSTLPADIAEAEVVAEVKASLGRPAALIAEAAAAAAPPRCPTNMAADAPAYNPAFWNTPQTQPRNNCYNYANNQATNTFAQPGRATGGTASQMSCAAVAPLAQRDGLRPAANFSGRLNRGQGWYVALVIWPGRDYHWYRQDNVGCWSHKPGQTAARNTDNSGQPIADPRTCNRGPYTQFCGFMISGSWVRIR